MSNNNNKAEEEGKETYHITKNEIQFPLIYKFFRDIKH